jgi:5'-methylthioadenosine nucleosidase
MDVRGLAEVLGLRTAIVSSGSSLDYTERDLEILAESGATLKEMEAAAIAWVCHWAGVPFFAVKAVTNVLGARQPPSVEFLRNFDVAVAALTREVHRVLGEL